MKSAKNQLRLEANHDYIHARTQAQALRVRAEGQGLLPADKATSD